MVRPFLVWSMSASGVCVVCGRSWDTIAFPRLVQLAIYKPSLCGKWFGVGMRVGLMFDMWASKWAFSHDWTSEFEDEDQGHHWATDWLSEGLPTHWLPAQVLPVLDQQVISPPPSHLSAPYIRQTFPPFTDMYTSSSHPLKAQVVKSGQISQWVSHDYNFD